MPTASVARMPPSTPHRTTRPTVPSPKIAVTTLMTAGEIHAVHAAVSTRASRSPTMKSVANTATMTPIMIGMPVRGAVVRRHQRSAATRVSWAAAASARASACRALEISSARPSSWSVRNPSLSRPSSRVTSRVALEDGERGGARAQPAGRHQPGGVGARRDVEGELLQRAPRSRRQRGPRGRAEAAPGRDAQDGGLQLGQALAARRDGGHHGDAEVTREHLGVRRTTAPPRLVREVEGDDDAVAEVEELQRQVEAPRQVGRVGDGDDDPGPPLEQRRARRLLVVAGPVERIAARQVDDLDTPVLPTACRRRRRRPSHRRSWPSPGTTRSGS